MRAYDDADVTFLERHALAVATVIVMTGAALAVGHVHHSLFELLAAALRLAS